MITSFAANFKLIVHILVLFYFWKDQHTNLTKIEIFVLLYFCTFVDLIWIDVWFCDSQIKQMIENPGAFAAKSAAPAAAAKTEEAEKPAAKQEEEEEESDEGLGGGMFGDDDDDDW